MYDGAVLAACMDSRADFDRVRDYVDKSEFTPMAGYWWDLLVDWYDHDSGAKRADRPILRERGERRANEKHRETMVGYFDDLPDVGSPANVVSDLLEVKRHAKANELGAAAGQDSSRVLPLAREYVALLEAETLEKDTWIEAGDWDEVDVARDPETLTKILPLALNRKCGGGAGPGDHIGLFGATEIGKSLMAVNMVAGFLRQGKRVLYVSNEDAANKVKARVRCNLANMSPGEVRPRPGDATAKAEGKGAGLLLVGNMDPGDVRQIERKVDQWQADVVVVDQLRNLLALGGSRGAGITQRMDQSAQEFRSLIIRNQIIGVSVVQAHAGEHGKRTVWYHADDVDSSRTGYPAQCDLLIGIGADEDMIATNRRAISICKNKLGEGEPGSHEGFLVTYDLQRSKCR